MRNSFVFYGSWWGAIKNLPREIQGEVLTAIVEYGLSGETTESLKPITKAVLALVIPQIDSNNKKYENGLKGGRPSTKPKSNQNQTETYNDKCIMYNDINPPVCIPPFQGGDTTQNADLSDSGKPPECDNPVNAESPPVAEEKEKSSAKKEKEPVKRFQKPTIEEVKAYIAEKGYDVDAERFWNFYEAKEWFIGKNKMKNWRAAVATWQKKETDYVDIRQKRHDRRRGSEIRATCAEDYSEPL